MLPKHHAILGFIFALNLFIFFKEITLIPAIIIFLSSILIDVDHYLYYVFIKKDLSLKKAFQWFVKISKIYDSLSKNQRKKIHRSIFFFHGIEALVVLFLIGVYLPLANFIAYGFLFHLILDVLHSSLERARSNKLSFIYELIRARNKIYVGDLNSANLKSMK